MSMTDEQIAKLYDKHLRRAAEKQAWRPAERPPLAEVARPYREQLVSSGYDPEQAGAYDALLSAHARQMAPMFGQTPEEYEKNFLGLFSA